MSIKTWHNAKFCLLQVMANGLQIFRTISRRTEAQENRNTQFSEENAREDCTKIRKTDAEIWLEVLNITHKGQIKSKSLDDIHMLLSEHTAVNQILMLTGDRKRSLWKPTGKETEQSKRVLNHGTPAMCLTVADMIQKWEELDKKRGLSLNESPRPRRCASYRNPKTCCKKSVI